MKELTFDKHPKLRAIIPVFNNRISDKGIFVDYVKIHLNLMCTYFSG